MVRRKCVLCGSEDRVYLWPKNNPAIANKWTTFVQDVNPKLKLSKKSCGIYYKHFSRYSFKNFEAVFSFVSKDDCKRLRIDDHAVPNNASCSETYDIAANAACSKMDGIAAHRWVVKNSKPEGRGKAWKNWWTVPLNVIMVEISWGGSNGPICHGAGLHSLTLSDLIHSIELVNPNGELQEISDPEQIKAAAGCFELLGVVTSLTLKLDELTFANMKPENVRAGLAIPPPTGLQIPEGIDMSGISQKDKDEAFQKFVDLCETSYYSEFFWFILQKDCWINCWNNDGASEDAEDYPSWWGTLMQSVGTYLAGLANNTLFRILPAVVQANVLGWSAMRQLPNGKTIVTPLINGLHFVRGIHNMRVRDMEWEIPIPGCKDDPSNPDWSVCQHAWWAVIVAVYNRYNADQNDIPMRLTMEMRITGASNIIMAPQHGNTHGTCSIEILSPMNVKQSEFQEFMQEVTDEWTKYTGVDGAYLNTRTHWAKQWEGLTVRGKPINSYLRDDAYKTQIPLFQAQLVSIAHDAGISPERYSIFTNPLLKEIINPWKEAKGQKRQKK